MADSTDPSAPAEAPTPDANKPKGTLGVVLTTLPIALTALATAFAGLSSSELTQAMFHRTVAAQNQSKAGDQWAFFQAKRVRGTSLEMTADLIQTLGDAAPFDPEKTGAIVEQLASASTRSELKDDEVKSASARLSPIAQKWKELLGDPVVTSGLPYLTGQIKLPELEGRSPSPNAEAIDTVVQQIRRHKTESETAELVRHLRPDDIEESIRRAEQDVDGFDQACQPIQAAIDRVRALMQDTRRALAPLREDSPLPPSVTARLHAFDRQDKGLRLAILEFDSRRYRQESNLNRKTAEIYEVRVRRSGVESNRHRERSQMFFYSMLLAQGGVTLASLALARKERNSLWLIAAVAGLISLGFSGYIYLTF